jgi:DNA-binding MarR family transcriptional regulator
MEKKGYIRRVSVMKDARLKRILLTEKAIAIQKQNSFEIHQSFERTLREGLSDEELDVFFHCIEQMKKNLIESDYPNGDVSRKEMAARSIAEEL